MKISPVGSSSQQDFITSMQNFERLSKTLPATFDYSNWTEFMKHTTPGKQASISQGAQATTTKANRATTTARYNTLHRTKELQARQQSAQGMAAQLKTTKQQQNVQQKHARLIAQQAAASQATSQVKVAAKRQTEPQQKCATSQEGDGPLPESPPEPAPSSPPQMKTFAPPPPVAMRSMSLPTHTALDSGYAPPGLTKGTSTGSQTPSGVHARSTKRKAAELNSSGGSTTRASHFSPSKAINAAKNNIGAVQQLFKTHTPGSSSGDSPAPTILEKLQSTGPAAQSAQASSKASKGSGPAKLPSDSGKGGRSNLQRTDEDCVKLLADKQPLKYCFNCGNIRTKGNWRQFTTTDNCSHNLCNACGVYWKTKGTMRPEKLWNRNRQDALKKEFPPRSGSTNHSLLPLQVAELSSESGNYDHSMVIQTSPAKHNDDQTFSQRVRATRSSPAQHVRSPLRPTHSDIPRSHTNNRPTTPTRNALHELQINTPQLPPSPSPANGIRSNEFSFMQTPKNSTGKELPAPSPWKSLYTVLDDVHREGPASPARQRMENFFEEFGLVDVAEAHGMDLDFEALANHPFSPGMQEQLNSLVSSMSSPPEFGAFTSSATLGHENLTPDDPDITAPLQIGQKTQQALTPRASRGQEHKYFEEGGSLFTPNSTPRRYNTRSQPGSVQRGLRSAALQFDESMFGEMLST